MQKKKKINFEIIEHNKILTVIFFNNRCDMAEDMVNLFYHTYFKNFLNKIGYEPDETRKEELYFIFHELILNAILAKLDFDYRTDKNIYNLLDETYFLKHKHSIVHPHIEDCSKTMIELYYNKNRINVMISNEGLPHGESQKRIEQRLTDQFSPELLLEESVSMTGEGNVGLQMVFKNLMRYGSKLEFHIDKILGQTTFHFHLPVDEQE